MYLPSIFTEQDLTFAAQFIDEHPLATVVVPMDRAPRVDHLPFMRVGELAAGGRLIAHAAKSNTLWQGLEDGASAILVFCGASAYVSPSLYPSKAKTHEVVPTWNYVAVHLHGTLRCTQDDREKRAIVENMTSKMERERPAPWKVSDAPEQYLTKMLAGVVGLSFEISTIVAKTKASQNRTDEDRAGVIAGLAEESGSLEAATIAARGSVR